PRCVRRPSPAPPWGPTARVAPGTATARRDTPRGSRLAREQPKPSQSRRCDEQASSAAAESERPVVLPADRAAPGKESVDESSSFTAERKRRRPLAIEPEPLEEL